MSMQRLSWSRACTAATVAVLAAGCAHEEERFGTECSTEASIVFEGRAYTQGFDGVDRDAKDIEGRRLGLGEIPPSCDDLDGEGQKVVVFKIVGVRAERAVYVDPPFGAMGRDRGEK